MRDPIFLTPDAKVELAVLAALPHLSPAQARRAKTLAGYNAYLDESEIKYMVNDSPIQWTTQPILSKPRSGAKVNPLSNEQTQPWAAQGLSRAQWYSIRNDKLYLAPYLAKLPAKMDYKEGLKLYRLLRQLSTTHNLEFNGLWGDVALAVSKAWGGEAAVLVQRIGG